MNWFSMNYLRWVLFVVLLLVLGVGEKSFSQNQVTLNEDIKKIAKDTIFSVGQLAVSIRSLKTGNSVVAENDLKNMAPASNLKLLTTAAAMGILGDTFTFKTLLEYDGELKDSILYGNIYIRGSGDPSLGSDKYPGYLAWNALLKQWAIKIKEAGIRQIKGAVVADPTLYDLNSIPDHWPWGDIGNYYGAGVYGINLNENLYQAFFKGTKVGDSAKLQATSPELTDMSIVNHVLTGPAGSGDNAYIYSAPRTDYIYINGTIPANTDKFAVRGSIPNPPLFCAAALAQELALITISVSKKSYVLVSTSTTSAPRKLLFSYSSPPLKDIVKRTNVLSVNLNAEALLKQCGVKKYGIGSVDSGVKAIQEYWKQKGVNTHGWFMYDGSGLSPNNGISASKLTHALALFSKDRLFASFYATIPIAGQTGTVARLCKGTSAEGMVRAKSGTLSKVICYSGYFKAKSGEEYSFSILSNNYTCSNSEVTRRLERIMVLMVEKL